MLRAGRIARAVWMALPLLVAAGLAVVPTGGGPTICPFALLTGTACPGCGLTRAGAALMNGEIVAAFAFHPLIVPVGLAFGAAWFLGLVRRQGRPFRLDRRIVDRGVLALAALFALTWLIRLATGSLPPV
ncbi:MAG TPA: DUF2752 domain-containing protein [Acidimicrobiia bacterium]|nr:DUF2752 domain-containing protein [Acidimicrobiia bacterium]